MRSSLVCAALSATEAWAAKMVPTATDSSVNASGLFEDGLDARTLVDFQLEGVNGGPDIVAGRREARW